MKVKDLIELLEDMDPEANVFIMSQQSWPFENAIAGVAVREDVEHGDEDCDAAKVDDGTAPSDVFICEGEQLRYGSKAAWEVMSR